MKVIGQSIFYLIAFIPLRRYAGGYHANSEKKCRVISFFMVLTSFIVMRCLNDNGVCILIIGAVVFGVFILGLAPIENENKKLDAEERKQYKNATRKILVTEIVCLLILHYANLQWVVEGIAISIITVGVVLILGILKNGTIAKKSEGGKYFM